MTSPYKDPKSGTYHLRMAVLKELVSIIGKTVFRKSLRTKDLKEARLRFIEPLADAQQQIALARLELFSEPNIEISVRDCAIIAERWYKHCKSVVDGSGNYSDYLTLTRDAGGYVYEIGLSDTLSISGIEIDTATPLQLQKLSEELKEPITAQLKRDGLFVSDNSDSFRRLAVAFYHNVYRVESLCRARYKHDFGYDPIKNPIAHESLSVTQSTVTAPIQAIQQSLAQNPISSLFESFVASETLKGKGEKGRDEIALHMLRLVEVIGDIDVTAVTRGHIVNYRDTLLQLPKSKAKDIRSKSVAEQIKIANREELARISPTTVKNCIRGVSRVFSHVVEVGLIDENPTAKVKLPTAPQMTEFGETRGYSEADIEKLFKSELFNNVNERKPYGMACYWIPLLCRYTGARLNEITQLHKSDISKKVFAETDIYYLNIRRGEGQSVKSNSSLRHIPIPEHIIELGFLDYVAASDAVLFPDIPESKTSKASSKVSKWWSKMVKEVGVNITQPAHAFRHSFKTAMRSANVQDTVSDAITGHTPSGVGGSYGTVDLLVKKRAIDCLPRLALAKLDFE